VWAAPLLEQLKSPLCRAQQEERKQDAETTTKNAVVERGWGEDPTMQRERSLRGARRHFPCRRYYDGSRQIQLSGESPSE